MSAEVKNVEKSDSSSSFEDLAGDSDLAETKPTTLPKQSSPSVKHADDEEWLDILGSKSILKKIIEKGDESVTELGEEAQKPQRFDLCTVSYLTTLADGNKTIVEQHNHIDIYVGDGEVIQGLDLAITLMHRGERSLLKMSPRFAYSDLGLKKSQLESSAPGFVDVDEKKINEGPPKDDEFVVAPEDWLLVDITLHDWKEEPDNDSLTLKERLELGRRRRIRGNWWYSRGDDAAAIRLYRRALDALHESTGGIEIEPDQLQLESESVESDVRLLIEERCRANNNLAASHLRSGALQAASQAVEAVLSCQPDNPKALYRKAKILLLSGEGGAAAEAAKAAAAAGAGGAAARLEARAAAKERRDTKDERQRAKRMLQGFTSDTSHTGDSGKPKPRSKFLVWGGLLLSFLVGVAGVLIYRYKLNN